LRESFKTKQGWDLTDGRFVLIDDVATTGATLTGCALALQKSGAEDVRGYVLAKKF
jgi:predicted amidophosphoribosyltransferase